MKFILASRLWEEKRRHWIDLAILLVLGWFLFIWGNHLYTLFNNSEPHYARVAQELAHHHDKLNLTFNGEPWYVHPPLHFWMTSTLCNWVGWHDWSIRLPEGVFGIFGLFAIYGMGTLCFNRKTGLLAALILGSSLYYVVMSRVGVFDTLLNTFILGTCWGFLGTLYDPKNKGKYALLGGISTGLAVLTKGPIGWIHPGVPILIYLTFTGSLKHLKDPFFLGGILLSFLIGAPWYVYELLQHGKPFFEIALKDYTWYRFFDVVEGQTGTWYFYLPVLLSFFPWITYVPLTLMQAKQAPFWKAPFEDPHKGTSLFSWIFIGFTFVFFSSAQTKLPSYILSLFPFLSLLIAHAILHLSHHPFGFKRAALTASFLCTTLLAMAWTLKLPAPFQIYHGWVVGFFAILAIGYGLAYAASFYTRRSSIGLSVTTMVIATFFLTHFILPLYDPYKSHQILLKALPPLTNEDTLICVNTFNPALKYYLNRNIPDVRSMHEAFTWMSTHPQSGKRFLIVNQNDLKSLPPSLKGEILTTTLEKEVLIQLTENK
jgi:4-amino-4-deoxy-L-arabinose transferase-like glycosyltransferase